MPPTFDIHAAVQGLRALTPSEPAEGEVWRALPQDAFGQLWSNETPRHVINAGGHQLLGVAREFQGRWRFVRVERADELGVEGLPFLKVYINRKNDFCKIGVRPGMIVGSGNLNGFGLFSIVLGFSGKGDLPLQNLPDLCIDYSHSPKKHLVKQEIARSDDEDVYTINYPFRRIWTLHRDDFLGPAGFSVTDGTTGAFGERLAEDPPLDLSRKILAGVLGLEHFDALERVYARPRPARAGREPRQSAPVLERGQLIAVRFGSTWTPCIIVSTTRFNSQAANFIIVGRATTWEQGDSLEDGLVEIPRSDIDLLDIGGISKKRWSLDCSLLRGISPNPTHVQFGRSPGTRIVFTSDDLFLRDVDAALRWLHISTPARGPSVAAELESHE